MRHLLYGALVLGALAACASVADLDVKYAPEIVSEAGVSDNDATTAPDRQNVRPSIVEPSEGGIPPVPVVIIDGCDSCDTSQGMACCIHPGGTAQCMNNAALDTNCQTGVFLGCLGSTTDNGCCWRTRGQTRVALPFDDQGCPDAGSAVCGDAGECPNGQACNMVTCNGIAFGECGGTPVCP